MYIFEVSWPKKSLREMLKKSFSFIFEKQDESFEFAWNKMKMLSI